MRIEQTPQFKRDFKRLAKKKFDMGKLKAAVERIAESDTETLKRKYRDHALKGNLAGYRELHIERDWLLVYRIEGNRTVLLLLRTGSHDEVL